MKLMTLTLLAMLSAPYTSVAANKCLTAVESFKWPSEGKPADMENLSNFSKKVLALGKLKKVKGVKAGSVQWTGPDKINHLYVGQHDIAERFSESRLSYHQERGRNPVDVTLWTFMNLGMDQAVDAILKSTSWKKLYDSAVDLQTAQTPEKAKASIQSILENWNQIKNGSALGSQENTEGRKLVVASAGMINSYYSSEKSATEIQKALELVIPLAYEQGRRVWLTNDSGSMINSQLRIFEMYSMRLENTSQASMSQMISSIQAEAHFFSQTLMKAQK